MATGADDSPLATAFMPFYYGAIMRGAPQELAQFYRESSKLSFEDQKAEGANCTQLLQQAGKMLFEAGKRSIQQHALSPAVTCILITGHVTLDGQTNKLQYTHSIQLMQEGEAVWICNDAIRLVYG
mmetsp:Transcript_31524/g.42685  ORF Transcript_31524/g.42685 Transcript_31524/m.42685 type:complete len:126 (-) Transcript_31524:669-1046(-)